MKVVSLTASVSRKAGGLFESVRRLNQGVAALPEVEVLALGLEDKFTAEDIHSWAPLPVQTFKTWGPPQFGYAPRLKDHVLSMNIDVLHNHGLWMYPSVVTAAWHKRSRRPYVVSPHGMLDSWAMRNSARKKWLARFLFENDHLHGAGCIRALCQSEANSIRALGLRNPVCVIPNGIDLPDQSTIQDPKSMIQSCEHGSECCSPTSVLSSARSEGRKILLYLGRIHPKKGLFNLLKAWATVQKSDVGAHGSDWLLAIAGWDQGDHEAELKQLATELAIPWSDVRQPTPSLPRYGGGTNGEASNPSFMRIAPSSLVFLGPQFDEAKAASYENCDAFILPSFSEGLPMVLLEAWAYAKPVLMTPECNLPEGFEANAALRIETAVDTIAAGLAELFRTPHSTLRLLGGNGRNLVASRFTWSQISREMWLLYDWLVGGGNQPESVQR